MHDIIETAHKTQLHTRCQCSSGVLVSKDLFKRSFLKKNPFSPQSKLYRFKHYYTVQYALPWDDRKDLFLHNNNNNRKKSVPYLSAQTYRRREEKKIVKTKHHQQQESKQQTTTKTKTKLTRETEKASHFKKTPEESSSSNNKQS